MFSVGVAAITGPGMERGWWLNPKMWLSLKDTLMLSHGQSYGWP